MGCTVSVHIDAPPDRVFDAASDIPHAHERCTAITNIEMLTQGPVGKGTRFRETRKVMGKEATEQFEVSRYDRPTAYDLTCDGHGCHFLTTVAVARAPEGGSTLSMDFRCTPRTLPAKVMNLVMGRMMTSMCRKGMQQDLADIKASIEGRAVGADADAGGK